MRCGWPEYIQRIQNKKIIVNKCCLYWQLAWILRRISPHLFLMNQLYILLRLYRPLCGTFTPPTKTEVWLLIWSNAGIVSIVTRWGHDGFYWRVEQMCCFTAQYIVLSESLYNIWRIHKMTQCIYNSDSFCDKERLDKHISLFSCQTDCKSLSESSIENWRVHFVINFYAILI